MLLLLFGFTGLLSTIHCFINSRPALRKHMLVWEHLFRKHLSSLLHNTVRRCRLFLSQQGSWIHLFGANVLRQRKYKPLLTSHLTETTGADDSWQATEDATEH